MDIAALGTQLLGDSLGQQSGGQDLTSALSSLLGDGKGGIDLQALASKMAGSGDLGDIVGSWLGEDENSPISADKLRALLGDSQIADFAAKIGTDSEGALNNLTKVLPQLMDKSSSGGNLLDSVGGVDGLLDAAKSFLK